MKTINRFYIDQPIQHWARTVLASEVNRLQYEIDCTKECLYDVYEKDSNKANYKNIAKGLKNRLKYLKIRMHRLSNSIRKVKSGELDDSAVRVIKNSAQNEFAILLELASFQLVDYHRRRRILKAHEHRMTKFKRHIAKQNQIKQITKAVNRMVLTQ